VKECKYGGYSFVFMCENRILKPVEIILRMGEEG
jgi:hypothetical protein